MKKVPTSFLRKVKKETLSFELFSFVGCSFKATVRFIVLNGEGHIWDLPILNNEKSPQKMSNLLNMAQNRIVLNFWCVFSKQESTSNQTANDNFHNQTMGE
jgi:hypothetical protein